MLVDKKDMQQPNPPSGENAKRNEASANTYIEP